MDHRQERVQAAVDAASALHPRSTIVAEWESVRNLCYAASAAYVQLDATSAAESANTDQHAGPTSELERQIDSACRGIDEFHERHKRILDEAAGMAAAVGIASEQALANAQRTRRRLEDADRNLVRYPSVQNAHEEFEARIQQLQLARQRGDLAIVQVAVEALTSSADTLESTLDSAPHRAEQARRAMASIHTRVEAARTRAAGVADVLSSLLREFHADSSADLRDNEREARIGIDRAAALMQQATAAVAEARPEAALDLVVQARAALSAADELIDAVTDRLAMLRGIREDPKQVERDVRFRLRDAQRLAVDRGAAGEWGSALDAQVARLDRIVETLTSRNPDYWRYQVQLQEVSDFVHDIVVRIRQRSAQ